MPPSFSERVMSEAMCIYRDFPQEPGTDNIANYGFACIACVGALDNAVSRGEFPISVVHQRGDELIDLVLKLAREPEEL